MGRVDATTAVARALGAPKVRNASDVRSAAIAAVQRIASARIGHSRTPKAAVNGRIIQ